MRQTAITFPITHTHAKISFIYFLKLCSLSLNTSHLNLRLSLTLPRSSSPLLSPSSAGSSSSPPLSPPPPSHPVGGYGAGRAEAIGLLRQHHDLVLGRQRTRGGGLVMDGFRACDQLYPWGMYVAFVSLTESTAHQTQSATHSQTHQRSESCKQLYIAISNTSLQQHHKLSLPKHNHVLDFTSPYISIRRSTYAPPQNRHTTISHTHLFRSIADPRVAVAQDPQVRRSRTPLPATHSQTQLTHPCIANPSVLIHNLSISSFALSLHLTVYT